jgi:hypothetical protein
VSLATTGRIEKINGQLLRIPENLTSAKSKRQLQPPCEIAG